MIPYGKQSISEDDINSVIKVLNSDWITQGPSVKSFEEQLKVYCRVNYSFAVCNATAALHLACLALSVGKEDIVWTSPNTFLSSANCALFCGAKVDFVDICPKTYNMSVIALENKLIEAKKKNKLPKVVIPVHFAGQSCEMKKIRELADIYGFKIIEDASHAIGGKYLGSNVGSCIYSDITVFSFHPVKIITTGEGGALLTNNPLIADKLDLLKTHGVTRDHQKMSNITEGPWYYEMIDLGYNYRITDIQCVLGLSQMNRLDEFVTRRHEIFDKYDELFKNTNLTTPFQSENCYSSLHLYPVLVDAKYRRKVFEYLRKSGIGVNVHYIPVYLQPYYKKLGFKVGYCPEAEKYYSREISLPMYYDLTTEQQEYVAEKLQEALTLTTNYSN